jgi:DNA-directed RNA polymerase specialized sigma24 family protein
LLGAAVDALQALCLEQGKPKYFEVFKRYLLDDDSSYREVAEALDLSVSNVTNYLSWTRREFRRLALEQLRDITASEEEFRSEAQALFGAEP